MATLAAAAGVGNVAGAFVPNPRYASLPGVPLFQTDVVAAAAAAAAPRKGGGGGPGGVPTAPAAAATADAGAAVPPSATTMLVPSGTGPPHPASTAVAPPM